MSKIPNGAKLAGFRECRVEVRIWNPDTGQRDSLGSRRGLVEMWIDWDAVIKDYGPKALLNKDKTCTLAGGNIVLKARGCRDTPA